MATEVCREAQAGQLVVGPLSPLSGDHMVCWQPISTQRPPLCLAPSFSFARPGSLQPQQEGGGEMTERREESSLLRERAKELEDENRERECLPSQPGYQDGRWGFSFSCHLDQPERKTWRRARSACCIGCVRLSPSQTQGETEACLSGEVQPRLLTARRLRLSEGSAAGSLSGIPNKDTRIKTRDRRQSRAMTGTRRRGEARWNHGPGEEGWGGNWRGKGGRHLFCALQSHTSLMVNVQSCSSSIQNIHHPFSIPSRLKQTAQHHPAGFTQQEGVEK